MQSFFLSDFYVSFAWEIYIVVVDIQHFKYKKICFQSSIGFHWVKSKIANAVQSTLLLGQALKTSKDNMDRMGKDFFAFGVFHHSFLFFASSTLMKMQNMQWLQKVQSNHVLYTFMLTCQL